MLKKMQGRIKESSQGMGLLLLKLFSGFMLGLTMALVIKEFVTFGQFMFTVIIVCFLGVFMRMSKKWKFSGVLLFNLFCVMTAMLLRMYITVAPGS